MSEHVEVQWAVDLGFGPCACRDEAYAREWVKSYEDHPDAMDPGDPWPVLLRRTVTATAWEPTHPRDTPTDDAQGGRADG